MIGESDDGDFDIFDIVIDWGVWVCCNGNKIKTCIIIVDIFDSWDLLRLWMKWMRRKRPESDVIPEQDKE